VGDALSGVQFNPPAPGDPCAIAQQNATGKWVTVVNAADAPPGAETLRYFSFNQPSVNRLGTVVFRGRARGSTGGEQAQSEGGGPLTGVWFRSLCSSEGILTKMVDRNTLVPAPNSNGVNFTETPSIPRIDADFDFMATRGNHQPVETVTLPDTTTTKAGTTGLYIFNSLLSTAMSNLGNFADFAQFSVPEVAPLTKFDVFPGSPSCSNGRFVVFKGNFVAEGAGRTGVFFKDTSNTNSAQRIANSFDLIPNQPGGGTVTFDSTAPPSAANGKMVFTGLDNEEQPTLGGIYLAPLTEQPPLTTLIGIGDAVPDRNGFALGDGSTFNAFGEGLAFDGRMVAFWGAWGQQKREIILECPADGNQALRDYCMANSPLPGGRTPVMVPVNQGIFVHDTLTGTTRMVSRSGEGEDFHDYLYWVFSGRPPGVGEEGDGDGGEAEPPRWRASAFTAVDSDRGVAFKGSRTPGQGVPSSGIYGAAFFNGNLTDVQKVLEVGDSAATVDAEAPADSTITALGIEREAIRGGWFTLSVSFLNPASESWAGIYATFVPTFAALPPAAPPTP